MREAHQLSRSLMAWADGASSGSMVAFFSSKQRRRGRGRKTTRDEGNVSPAATGEQTTGLNCTARKRQAPKGGKKKSGRGGTWIISRAGPFWKRK